MVYNYMMEVQSGGLQLTDTDHQDSREDDHWTDSEVTELYTALIPNDERGHSPILCQSSVIRGYESQIDSLGCGRWRR
jgi:hypothetical protein